jgi:hypothetical protein
VLGALPPANAANLTGLGFFPRLIAGPFHDGLVIVFSLAIAMSVVGALVSLLPGNRVAAPPGGPASDLVTREAELEAELVESQPFAPAARIPEPLLPAEGKPAEDQPAEDQPAEDQPAEDEPAGDKPAGDKVKSG